MWKGDWKNSWRNYSSDTEYARNLLFKQRCSLWKHNKFLSAHDNLWASACLAQAIISLLEETPSRVEGSVIPANSPDSIHTLEFDSYSSSNDTWLFWDCWSSHVCIRWCCSPTYYNMQFILYRTILNVFDFLYRFRQVGWEATVPKAAASHKTLVMYLKFRRDRQ